MKLFVCLRIQYMKDGIYITQSKYIKDILKNFGMEDSRLVGKPLSTRHKFSKDYDSKEVEQTTYRSIFGKIQYIVHTGPDIALAVGMVARFSMNPKDNYKMVIKRIMRYLKGTIEYGVWYNKRHNFELKVLK